MNAPRKNRQFKFLYSIPVIDKTQPEVSILKMTEFEIFHVMIPRLGLRYKTNAYDILKFNCNHFTDEFLKEITGGEFGLPSYINRAARLASWFHCVIPQRYLVVTPENFVPGDAINNINSSVS